MTLRNFVRGGSLGFVLALLLPLASAGTKKLLILHTNDIHDHVRAGENGLGGLPYVSGYVKKIRAERNDVLVLDAGDVAEKGDLVAFRTHSVMTYEAKRRIGYDAVTIGNHEHDEYGWDGLRKFERALGQPLLNLNLRNDDGSGAFEGSRIVTAGGLKVGLIGLLVPRKENCFDGPGSGAALDREEKRLRANGVALVVAVCHESARGCAEWSRMAPGVNVFVSGHSHEALHRPVVVPETGAIIVQAGSYARWVGRLELEVDDISGKIVRHAGELVAMRHADVPVDKEMLAWVRETEKRLAPEAADLVFDNPAEIDGFTVARIAAEALRQSAGADVGFCHPYQIIRNVLPRGQVDVNAVFKSGGQRGYRTMIVELTGEEIAAYLNALQYIQREPPEWAGFRAVEEKSGNGRASLRTDLDPKRSYRVIIPRLEWETRFLRLAEDVGKRDPRHPLAARKVTPVDSDVTFTGAMTSYLKATLAEGVSIASRAEELLARRDLGRAALAPAGR